MEHEESLAAAVAANVPSPLIAEAERAEAEGRPADAERIYREALDNVPAHPGISNALALLLHRRGASPEAEALLRKVLQRRPVEVMLHNTLGVILQHQGRLDEAEAVYRHALQLQPTYPDARYNLGLLLEESQRPDEALSVYRTLLGIHSTHASSFTRIAAIHLQRGEVHEAQLAADRAVAHAPDDFDARYYRGWARADAARTAEALDDYRHAARLRPGVAAVDLAIANALRDAGRLDEALDGYLQLTRRFPAEAQFHIELNRLAWLAGRRDLYLTSLAEARERQPENVELYTLEASFHLRQDDYLPAEALLRRAAILAPSNPAVAGMLARALAGQGRIAESESLFMHAINAEPDVPTHRQELGFALLKAARPDDAIHVFSSALAQDRTDQLALAGLSLALRAMEDPRYSWLVDYERYVQSYELPLPRGFQSIEQFMELLAGELVELHTLKMEPVDQSLRGGTQTIGRLFSRNTPAIKALQREIEMAVGTYLTGLPSDPAHPVAARRTGYYTFSGSWSCRLHTGGFHREHVHPQGWISSAFYARLPGNTQENGKEGSLAFGRSPYQLGAYDSAEMLVNPSVGKLVLFPSYFWHGTIPFKNAGDRLTVAFDVVPSVAPAV